MLRLKTRPQFQAAMAGGTVSRTPHFALHRLPLPVDVPLAGAPALPSAGPDDSLVRKDQVLFVVSGVWLGAMVPKRWARRAVTRNTIKRQVYGIGAEYESRLPPGAHVVRLRATFDRKQFISATSDLLRQAVREELNQLFRRACAPAGRPPAPTEPVAGAAP